MRNLYKSLIAIIIFIGIFPKTSSAYSLIKDEIVNDRDEQISYRYDWKKVRNLSRDTKEILGLTSNEDRLEVLSAHFEFYIIGEVDTYDSRFYSKLSVLEALSGMEHTSLGPDRYSVHERAMGVRVSAEVSLKFDGNYENYQRVFDYHTQEEEGYLVHQRAENFNKVIESTNIISHLTQQGPYVKVTIDSFAVLKKSKSKYFTYAAKKIILKKMKSQILKSPQVYINYAH